MGVTVVGELQDIISLYDDLYEIFDKDEKSITLMADIDKAIGSDDLIDLEVENQDKTINVEAPEDIEIDLSVFERGEDGTLTFGSVLTPDLSEQFNDNLAEYLEQR